MADAFGLTIHVKWTCQLCGKRNITTDVPARGDENVIEWMDATMACLKIAHRRVSPRCLSEHLDLMVPMDPTKPNQRLGAATTH